MPNFKLAGKWKELLDNPEESFYNSEMKKQDEEVKRGNQQLINQGYNVKLDDPLSLILDKSTGQRVPVPSKFLSEPQEKPFLSENTKAKLYSLLGTNVPTPVVNTFLQDKTAQQYTTDQQGFEYSAPIDLIGKAAKRLGILGKQQVDNIPGLNSIATGQEDQMSNISGALIQAGGRFLPLAGIGIQTLNAGPTGAGTLEDARKKGWIR